MPHKTDVFLAKAMEYEGDDCLLWPYAKNNNGYPQFRRGKKIFYAHRVICERAHGEAPEGKPEATHSCGNGHLGCVTKRHLRWKSHQENMDDKLAHGTVVRGSAVGNSKLTEDVVREIRSCQLSQSKTAKLYGVSQAQVWRIKNNQRWSWLT